MLTTSEKIMQSMFMGIPTLVFGILTIFIIYFFYSSFLGWIVAVIPGFATYYFGNTIVRLWKEF